MPDYQALALQAEAVQKQLGAVSIELRDLVVALTFTELPAYEIQRLRTFEHQLMAALCTLALAGEALEIESRRVK